MIKCSCGSSQCKNSIRFNVKEDTCELWIVHAKGDAMMYAGVYELHRLAWEAINAAMKLEGKD